MSMRVVMLGDIVGRSGRCAVIQQLPRIHEQWKPDLIVVNGENIANGSGITPKHHRDLIDAGVHGITLGDHVYKKKQIVTTLEQESNIIRPANLAKGAKGKTWMRLTPKNPDLPPLYVLTVLGRIFMSMPANDPFATAEQIISQLPDREPIILLEVHAEATSEKKAMGWFFNGRVAAVVGTHTHVATADARILPVRQRGLPATAYITDLGMCGAQESVLGRDIEPVLTHMTTAMPAPFDTAEGDPRVCGVFIEIDPERRRATAIERIELSANPSLPPYVL